MVWSQYVYEATHGYDAYSSDENDVSDDHAQFTIDDFYDEFSDELHRLHGITQTLVHDAFLEHTYRPTLSDFIDLCFYQFEDDPMADAIENCEHRSNAEYILSSLSASDPKHLVKNVTIDNFIRFLKQKY
jgi:hypothetical protein